jgi:acyl carrier protein
MSMNPEKVVEKAFREALDLPEEYELTEDGSFNSVPGWDSMGHMQIVSEIESMIGESLDMEEIIDLDRVDKVIKLVKRKDGTQ